MPVDSTSAPETGTGTDSERPEVSRHAIVLFDGVCTLCNGFVNFVIDNDPEGYFRLGALQSDAARPYLQAAEQAVGAQDTVVLIENGQLYTRSSAALRVLRRLSLPWSLFYGLILVPKPVRDWVYDFIASRRYEWFGRRDHCRRPTPEVRQRFLEEAGD